MSHVVRHRHGFLLLKKIEMLQLCVRQNFLLSFSHGEFRRRWIFIFHVINWIFKMLVQNEFSKCSCKLNFQNARAKWNLNSFIQWIFSFQYCFYADAFAEIQISMRLSTFNEKISSSFLHVWELSRAYFTCGHATLRFPHLLPGLLVFSSECVYYAKWFVLAF